MVTGTTYKDDTTPDQKSNKKHTIKTKKEMKTQTNCDPARTAYDSPRVRDVEMRVHGVLCASPKEETDTKPEEDLF